MQERSKMQKKKSAVARRAWNILRLALLWARKGGIFRNRHLIADLRLLPKYIKSLRHTDDYGYGVGPGVLHYGEREFSFDDTPIIHVKMHRPASLRFKMPNIPCIKPQVDFDFNFENDHHLDDEMYHGYDDDVPRRSFLKGADDDNEDDEYASCEVTREISCPGDEAIDMKAEQFIAKFYEQIKLQKQMSCLQYHETYAN
uniref:Uncharacterized protein LOC104243143 n=2 Tax=Nicotiana sylvestris TaxID=4096 RepID=A0A1U7XX92_NICSY|nr:PREDICTED: uncharacterized protein LOC104243143 [Nicotiana sylvestris]